MAEPFVRPAEGEPVYHLTPAEVWHRQAGADAYLPEAFGVDGFVHCTVGAANLVEVANHYYRADARPHVAMVVALLAVESPVRIDDPHGIFPHIHGPINRSAILAVHEIRRSPEGTFLELGERLHEPERNGTEHVASANERPGTPGDNCSWPRTDRVIRR